MIVRDKLEHIAEDLAKSGKTREADLLRLAAFKYAQSFLYDVKETMYEGYHMWQKWYGTRELRTIDKDTVKDFQSMYKYVFDARTSMYHLYDDTTDKATRLEIKTYLLYVQPLLDELKNLSRFTQNVGPAKAKRIIDAFSYHLSDTVLNYTITQEALVEHIITQAEKESVDEHIESCRLALTNFSEDLGETGVDTEAAFKTLWEIFNIEIINNADVQEIVTRIGRQSKLVSPEKQTFKDLINKLKQINETGAANTLYDQTVERLFNQYVAQKFSEEIEGTKDIEDYRRLVLENIVDIKKQKDSSEEAIKALLASSSLLGKYFALRKLGTADELINPTNTPEEIEILIKNEVALLENKLTALGDIFGVLLGKIGDAMDTQKVDATKLTDDQIVQMSQELYTEFIINGGIDIALLKADDTFMPAARTMVEGLQKTGGLYESARSALLVYGDIENFIKQSIIGLICTTDLSKERMETGITTYWTWLHNVYKTLIYFLVGGTNPNAQKVKKDEKIVLRPPEHNLSDLYSRYVDLTVQYSMRAQDQTHLLSFVNEGMKDLNFWLKIKHTLNNELNAIHKATSSITSTPQLEVIKKRIDTITKLFKEVAQRSGD